jgi:hypothetical protein
MLHYRDRQLAKVDVIVESADGRIASQGLRGCPQGRVAPIAYGWRRA